jgi:diguanylate cyclase (GGDEF)-like protein
VEVKKADRPIEVLLIEDDAGDLLLTKRMLAKTDYNAFHLICAESLSTAIKCTAEAKIDVILSDLNLPDSSGIETFLKLKLQVPEIPIVVFSGFGDEAEFLKAVREGAQDYLIKGQVDGNSLVRSLRYAIERKMAEDNIRRLAYHDSLTGLPSRTLFADRCMMAMAENRRNQKKTALIMVDLDHFKDINDNLGHDAGDEVLKEVGARLESILRQTDTICRIGGDEFALLISDVSLKETVKIVAKRIIDVLNKPFTLNGLKEVMTASLGIAIYPEDGKSLRTLMKHADMAMYEVKKRGRNNYLYYQPSMNIKSLA